MIPTLLSRLSWRIDDGGLLDKARLKRTYFLHMASLSLSMLGIYWLIVYASKGYEHLAAVHAVMMILGLSGIVVTRYARPSTAAVVVFHFVYAAITLSSLFDIPTDGIQRTTHLFLIPLFIISAVVFANSNMYCKYVLPITCAATYVLLSLWRSGLSDPGYLADLPARHAASHSNIVVSGLIMIATIVALQATNNETVFFNNEVRKSLRDRRFSLVYQPQCDAQRRTVGFEALLRWLHPVYGNMSPASFIPALEASGAITPVGNMVLREALILLARWHLDPTRAELAISVNVSPRQLLCPKGVAAMVAIIEEYPGVAHNLMIEVTESAFAEKDILRERLLALTQTGVKTSIDDFGKGESSLGRLGYVSCDEVKLDMAITQGTSRMYKASLVNMLREAFSPKAIGIVAEGIEDERQFDEMVAIGCTRFQGYLISRPLPAERLDQYLTAA